MIVTIIFLGLFFFSLIKVVSKIYLAWLNNSAYVCIDYFENVVWYLLEFTTSSLMPSTYFQAKGIAWDSGTEIP